MSHSFRAHEVGLAARQVERACHEGNYAIVGILAGARVEEKAVEEAAKKGSSK